MDSLFIVKGRLGAVKALPSSLEGDVGEEKNGSLVAPA